MNLYPWKYLETPLKKPPLAGPALSSSLDQRHSTPSTNTTRTSCSSGAVSLRVPASNYSLTSEGTGCYLGPALEPINILNSCVGQD